MKTIKYDAAETKVVAKLNSLLSARREYLKAFADQHRSTLRLKQTHREGRRAYKALEQELKRSVRTAKAEIKKRIAGK